jgi:hypothetical protein
MWVLSRSSKRYKNHAVMTPKWQTKTFLSRENVFGFVVGLSLVAVLFLVSRSGKGVKDLVSEGKDVAQQQMVFFEPPTFHFGTILQQETVRHTFRLVNRGTGAVQILALRSTCNCTIIKEKLAGMNISPSGSLVIPVEFASGSQEGAISSAVEALLECEGVRYHARARLHGNVNADFTFLPRMVDFGSLEVGEKATETIDFQPGALKGFLMKNPQPTRSEFTVSFANATNDEVQASAGKRPQLAVTFEAPVVNRSTVFSGAIEVETSSERMPMVRIPVRASVRPNVEVTPEVVVLPAAVASGESRFKIRTLQPSKIVRATILTPDGFKRLQPNIETTDLNQSWELTHIRHAQNASLADAERIDFELEVRSGIGRKEARTVSVQVQRL